jgi:hypothetical protein
LPALDQVHRPGRIARPDDHRARPDVDRLELREHDADDGFRGKSCEGRKASEESLELTMLGLQLEVGADIGRALEQTVERRPIEPQRQHVAAGAHRRRTSRAVEQFDLAEAVAGAQDVQRNLIAVVRALDHAGPPETRTYQPSAASPSDTITPPKGNDTATNWRTTSARASSREKPQDREIVEDTEFGHAASPPVEVSRGRIAQPSGDVIADGALNRHIDERLSSACGNVGSASVAGVRLTSAVTSNRSSTGSGPTIRPGSAASSLSRCSESMSSSASAFRPTLRCDNRRDVVQREAVLSNAQDRLASRRLDRERHGIQLEAHPLQPVRVDDLPQAAVRRDAVDERVEGRFDLQDDRQSGGDVSGRPHRQPVRVRMRQVGGRRVQRGRRLAANTHSAKLLRIVSNTAAARPASAFKWCRSCQSRCLPQPSPQTVACRRREAIENVVEIVGPLAFEEDPGSGTRSSRPRECRSAPATRFTSAAAIRSRS